MAPDAAAPAEFSADVNLSKAIQTVGVIQWTWVPSHDAAAMRRATVRFGRTPLGGQDPVWEHAAPEDLVWDRVEGDDTHRYRTVLLGMKQNDTYSVRIEVETTQDVEQVSESYTLRTGALPNGLAPVAVTDVFPEKVYGGFTTACSGISSPYAATALSRLAKSATTAVQTTLTSIGLFTPAATSNAASPVHGISSPLTSPVAVSSNV